MANRSQDWFRQAQRDLEQAECARAAGHHEWCCFISQQAAEKSLPVPADLLVYTETEWGSIDPSSRFGQVLATATRWVYARDAPGVPPTPPS